MGFENKSMKVIRWTLRWVLGVFLVLLGLSMLVGQTFRFQGYILGLLGITAGVQSIVKESHRD